MILNWARHNNILLWALRVCIRAVVTMFVDYFCRKPVGTSLYHSFISVLEKVHTHLAVTCNFCNSNNIYKLFLLQAFILFVLHLILRLMTCVANSNGGSN